MRSIPIASSSATGAADIDHRVVPRNGGGRQPLEDRGGHVARPHARKRHACSLPPLQPSRCCSSRLCSRTCPKRRLGAVVASLLELVDFGRRSCGCSTVHPTVARRRLQHRPHPGLHRSDGGAVRRVDLRHAAPACASTITVSTRAAPLPRVASARRDPGTGARIRPVHRYRPESWEHGLRRPGDRRSSSRADCSSPTPTRLPWRLSLPTRSRRYTPSSWTPKRSRSST